MYAVERVQQGIYAMCRLGKWVTYENIQRLQAMSLENMPSQRKVLYEQANASSNDWWQPAAIHANHGREDFHSQKQKFAKLENFRLCLKTPTTNTINTYSAIEELRPKRVQERNLSTFGDMMGDSIPQDTPQEPEEVLGMIKAQYQAALYVSKVRKLTIHVCS